MKGKPEVLQVLISALAQERHANLQFRSDRLSLKKLGARKTSEKFDKFADKSHGFYEELTKRLLFLDGNPSGSVDPVSEADSLTGVLQNALAIETASCGDYEQAIQVAMKAYDDGTRNLFEHLVKWKQRIINWLMLYLVKVV